MNRQFIPLLGVIGQLIGGMAIEFFLSIKVELGLVFSQIQQRPGRGQLSAQQAFADDLILRFYKRAEVGPLVTGRGAASETFSPSMTNCSPW